MAPWFCSGASIYYRARVAMGTGLPPGKLEDQMAACSFANLRFGLLLEGKCASEGLLARMDGCGGSRLLCVRWQMNGAARKRGGGLLELMFNTQTICQDEQCGCLDPSQGCTAVDVRRVPAGIQGVDLLLAVAALRDGRCGR